MALFDRSLRPASAPEYTVFIDESAWGFFRYKDTTGNFCYAGLSIRSDALGEMAAFEAAFQNHIRDRYQAQHGAALPPGEIKSTVLDQLDAEDISFLGRKLNWFLQKNRCALFGFFTDVEGLVHNEIRDEFHDSPSSLRPGDKAHFDEFHRELMRKVREKAHNLGELQRLYQTFAGFCGQHHGRSLRSPFRVQYDPRNASENTLLHIAAQDFLALAERAFPGVGRYYRGADYSLSSEQSPGLRIVDFIAGDLRNTLRRYPALREDQSRLEILSPRSAGVPIIYNEIVWGFKRPMDTALRGQVLDTTNGLLFPSIWKHFAQGVVTCYARFGEARHIDFREECYQDMVD
jgi:hypothetical protein